MQQREIPNDLKGTQTMARDYVGYISRRAIASARHQAYLVIRCSAANNFRMADFADIPKMHDGAK